MKTVTAMAALLVLLAGWQPAFADPEDRQDRRQERGRADERHDRRDCRREEGYVGEDKRECKQEEVRDGVRGNRDERFDNDDDEVHTDD